MKDLQVRADIDILKVPCDLVDVRFTSMKGRQHTITRQTIKPNGRIRNMVSNRKPEDIIKALESGEGCKVSGNFFVHFLSNSFYIGYGNPFLLTQLMMEMKHFKYDLSHRINHLSFGSDSEHKSLAAEYGLQGFNTLDGHSQIEPENTTKEVPVHHSYYITTIPSVFDYSFVSLETFQYTASHYSKPSSSSGIVFQ